MFCFLSFLFIYSFPCLWLDRGTLSENVCRSEDKFQTQGGDQIHNSHEHCRAFLVGTQGINGSADVPMSLGSFGIHINHCRFLQLEVERKLTVTDQLDHFEHTQLAVKSFRRLITANQLITDLCAFQPRIQLIGQSLQLLPLYS